MAMSAQLAQDLGDWFVFTLGEPMMELVDTPYGGTRLPVECLLADRVFLKFHVDVALGDAVSLRWYGLKAMDRRAFAGIAPARIATMPIAQHFAEK